ncbi:ABC transporter permease [Chloroflexota bacterium]
MRAYLIRRILLIIPTLLLVTMIIFFLVQIIPGSAMESILADFEYRYQESDLAAMKEALGIDVPVHVQYVRWLGGILRGDLGDSLWTGRPVLGEIIQKLPVSGELGLMAVITGLLIAIPIGTYSAIRQDTAGDYISRSLAILAIAIPGFWLGTMIFVYPSIWWNWTPRVEYIPFIENPLGNLGQFMLPGFVLGMHLSGTTMRMTRTMMLEVLRQDYIRTAWSKGLGERAVVFQHALKNALIPVVTLVGLQISIVLGSAVVIEQIFVLPGLGSYLLESINRRDFIVLSGINLFVATGVMVFNLIVDLTYAYLDPRVQYK